LLSRLILCIYCIRWFCWAVVSFGAAAAANYSLVLGVCANSVRVWCTSIFGG
jgi:hypothetical protein